MASSDILPYPFQFDPSQFANKYSNYAGVPLPWPSQYAGTPTDARGQPIQSYLNAQSAAAAAPAQAPPVTLNTNPQMPAPNYLAQAIEQGNWSPGAGGGGFGGGGGIGGSPGSGALLTDMLLQGRGGAPRQAAAAPQAAAPAGPDMSQAYLAALSNPGRVTTPGATVPQAAPPSNQSGVLQSFLQNWQNKGSPTTGAGNYNNAGFFNALQGNT